MKVTNFKILRENVKIAKCQHSFCESLLNRIACSYSREKLSLKQFFCIVFYIKQAGEKGQVCALYNPMVVNLSSPAA